MALVSIGRGHSFGHLCRVSLVALLSITSVLAGGPKTASPGPKPVHVREYTRKDGTIVGAYDRAAPGTAQHPEAANQFGIRPETTLAPVSVSESLESKASDPLVAGRISGSRLALPAWVIPMAGARELGNAGNTEEATISYLVPSTAVTLVAGYQDQLRRARIAFEAVFNGMGTAIRATEDELSCVVRITEDSPNSKVVVRCAIVNSANADLRTK